MQEERQLDSALRSKRASVKSLEGELEAFKSGELVREREQRGQNESARERKLVQEQYAELLKVKRSYPQPGFLHALSRFLKRTAIATLVSVSFYVFISAWIARSLNAKQIWPFLKNFIQLHQVLIERLLKQ